MTDWFMPPVNHLHAPAKRMALPGAIPSYWHRLPILRPSLPPRDELYMDIQRQMCSNRRNSVTLLSRKNCRYPAVYPRVDAEISKAA
jgi:hypothetical protein